MWLSKQFHLYSSSEPNTSLSLAGYDLQSTYESQSVSSSGTIARFLITEELLAHKVCSIKTSSGRRF